MPANSIQGSGWEADLEAHEFRPLLEAALYFLAQLGERFLA